jgi:uncharacterized OB-fold protein
MTRAQIIPGEFIKIATNVWTEPFWQAAKEGRLVGCKCAKCGQFRMPPSPFCPNCQSQEIDWTPLSGRGVVYSFSVCHRSPFPGMTPEFTYVPAIVELPDAPGTRLCSNIVDVDSDDVHIGMDVEILWGDAQDGWKVPIFRPKK